MRMFLHMKDFAKITRCVSNRNLGLMYTREPHHGATTKDRYFNEPRIKPQKAPNDWQLIVIRQCGARDARRLYRNWRAEANKMRYNIDD